MSEVVTIDQEQQMPVVAPQEQHMQLIQLAVEKGADIEKLEKLMDLQDRFEAKNARKAFFNALSKFQSELPVIKKQGLASFDHKNGGGNTSYTYAKLEDIAKAIKPLLSANGLSYRYEQQSDQQCLTIVCIVTHEEGHEERTQMSGFPDQSGKKNPIQQIASTVSYLRRYTLTGALGITVSDEDDDGATYEEQQIQAEYYPQEDFEMHFPNWEKAILAGKKTPGQIIKAGNAQGITFSRQQIVTIEKVGNV